MTHSHKHYHKLAAAAAASLIILAAVVISAWKTDFYPVALVDGRFVSAEDWQRYEQVAYKLDPKVSRAQIYQQFLFNKQKEQLVLRSGIKIRDAYEREKLFYQAAENQQYADLISKYFGGDESKFFDYVVVPQTDDALLRIKSNQNFAANNDAYNKAQNILSKLSQGQKFEDLAKQYSDDKVTGQLGGDLGFVNEHQLLPELEQAVLSARLGEVDRNIVISRYGYHVIYPVETAERDGTKVWHVKQILIQTSSYDSWLAKQLQTIHVWRIIRSS